MNFRHERSLLDYLPHIKALATVLLTCLVTFLVGACTENEKPETEVTRVQMPIRRPMPKPPAPLDQNNTGEQKDKKEGLEQIPLPEKQLDSLEGPRDEEGYYRVQKGDTLLEVAGLKNVYDDPIKWTSLFRLNMDKLDGMASTADFPKRELPEGLDLKFITKSEAEENLGRLGQSVYSVNVLSAETPQKIVPRAITLMKNGYNAYICTATVKGKKWLRLRAGFFKGYSQAVEAGEHIKTILDESNVWVVRVKRPEREQFAGY